MTKLAINPGDQAATKVFLADLRFALASGQRDLLEEVTSRADQMIRASSESERERLISEIVEVTGCKRETAERILGSVGFLAMGAVSAQSAKDPVGDLVSATKALASPEEGGLSSEDEQVLKELLGKLTKEAPNLRRAALTARAIRGELPMFEELEATIELRSNHSPFASPEELKDLPQELVPIASIRLILDSGQPRTTCFQATEQDLATLADRIQRLRDGLAILQKRVHIGELK